MRIRISKIAAILVSSSGVHSEQIFPEGISVGDYSDSSLISWRLMYEMYKGRAHQGHLLRSTIRDIGCIQRVGTCTGI
ncbi:hypothetical protein F5890DRAFT_1536185 [Lentinula detonsa]|uniref:Uncharacterized protein n=1 Tax=Lentinula detonsa TaxID=2804962 RepID=A0AA38PT18_9AGAR|nr:hypothetical protein F5890DRAFT_1536185 [Lentinula detonsa]